MTEFSRTKDRSAKKSKRKRKITLLVGISIIVLLISGISYATHIYLTAQKTAESSFEEVDRENDTSNLRDKAVNPIEDNVSILIIGVDDSEERGFEENSRSDTLILATFNKQDNDIKLLTIPRDSHVFVPETNSYTKINHAHFFGGPKATIETVESFLNVPVDYFIRLNFDAFIEVVDALGGIRFNVPFEMHELDSEDNKQAIHLLPGYQNLNGEEALAVARTRRYDSDIDRGKRQQEIIKTIVKQSASGSTLFKLDDLIKAVGNNMNTNLTFEEMRSFISYGMNTNLDLETMNFEGQGGKLEDGLWYYQVDEDSRREIQNELRKHLDLPPKEMFNTEFGTESESNSMNSAY